MHHGQRASAQRLGITFKLLGTIAGLGLIVLVIVWVVLVKTGHLAT